MANQHTVVQDIRNFIAKNNLMADISWEHKTDNYRLVFKAKYDNLWRHMIVYKRLHNKGYGCIIYRCADIDTTKTPWVVHNFESVVWGQVEFYYSPRDFIKSELEVLAKSYERKAYSK